jgi:hypothetical protein
MVWFYDHGDLKVLYKLIWFHRVVSHNESKMDDLQNEKNIKYFNFLRLRAKYVMFDELMTYSLKANERKVIS